MSTSGPLGSSKPTGPGIPLSGVYNVTSPTPADGQQVALQVDSQGNLLVNVAVGGGGGGSNASVGIVGAAAPNSATEIGFVDVSGKLQHISGLDLTNANALTVAIVDGSGNQITSFGGGIQFADNAASGATPTGTLSMGWDSVNSKIRALKVDSNQNLIVSQGDAAAQTSPWPTIGGVSSVVTATWNSGTAQFSSLAINCSGMGSVAVTLSFDSGTFTAGALAFDTTGPGVSNIPITGMRENVSGGGVQSYDAGGTHFISSSDSSQKWLYWFNVSGVTQFSVFLSNTIVGTGNLTISMQASASGALGPTTVGQSDFSKLRASVAGLGAAGSLVPSNPVMVGGSDYGAPAHAQILKVDSSGQIYVGNAVSISGNVNVTQGTSPWVVSGTVTVNQGTSPWVTADNHFPNSSALADGTSNPTTTQIGANLLGWDSVNSVWRRVQVDSATGFLKVDNTSFTQPTSDIHFPAAVALSDLLANPTTTEIGANLLGWDATNTVWRRVQVDAGTGTLKVDGSGSTQPVSGTVTANQGGAPWSVRPDGITWALTGASAAVFDTHFPASASLSDALVNPVTTQIGANLQGWDATNTVWRRVQVDAGTGLLKVDGSGATQPVSGSVSIIGSIPVNQNSTPWVTSDNHFPASAALADNTANPSTTQIGANLLGWDATNSNWHRIQVDAGTGILKVDASGFTQPISGTIGVTQSTSPWTVQGSGTQAQNAAVWDSTTILNTAVVPISNSFVNNTIAVELVQTATITGGIVTFEGFIDGTNWIPMIGVDQSTGLIATGSGQYAFQASTNKILIFDVSGVSSFRYRLSAVITGTGTVTSSWLAQSLGSPNAVQPQNFITGAVFGNQAIVTVIGGSDYVGTPSHAEPLKVDAQGRIFVGNFPLPATVTLADNLVNPTTTEIGANLLGWDATNAVWRRVQVDAGTGTLKVDGSGSTQPVSGTVSISGTVAVTQSTSPWVTSDNHFPVSAALADNSANPTTTEIGAMNFGWDATNSVWNRLQVDAGTGTLKVDGSGSTQPVSGTVTVNQGTNPWAVSAASLPLPANAAVEAGGNLATIATQTRNSAQIVDLLNQVIRHLQLLNINVASSVPGADSTIDAIDGAAL